MLLLLFHLYLFYVYFFHYCEKNINYIEKNKSQSLIINSYFKNKLQSKKEIKIYFKFI